MAFGIKNNFILKLIIFVASVIIMIGGYSFGSALYKGMFDITYHLIFLLKFWYIKCHAKL